MFNDSFAQWLRLDPFWIWNQETGSIGPRNRDWSMSERKKTALFMLTGQADREGRSPIHQICFVCIHHTLFCIFSLPLFQFSPANARNTLVSIQSLASFGGKHFGDSPFFLSIEFANLSTRILLYLMIYFSSSVLHYFHCCKVLNWFSGYCLEQALSSCRDKISGEAITHFCYQSNYIYCSCQCGSRAVSNLNAKG